MKNSFKFKRLIPKKPYSDWLRNIYSNRDLSMQHSDYFSENSGTHLDPHIPEQDSQNSDQPNSSDDVIALKSGMDFWGREFNRPTKMFLYKTQL